MMYGFGDVKDPEPQTVALVQDLLFEFIEEMVTRLFLLTFGRPTKRWK